MELKGLLIVLILLGTGNSIYSIIGAGLFLGVLLINLFLRTFWNSEKTMIYSVLLTGLLVSIILEIGKTISYQWSIDNYLFVYTLSILPIILLDYKGKNYRIIIKEAMIYIDAFIFIGVLKELFISGSIFSFVIIKHYEGLLIFNNNSGTLLLIGITMIISDFLKRRRDK